MDADQPQSRRRERDSCGGVEIGRREAEFRFLAPRAHVGVGVRFDARIERATARGPARSGRARSASSASSSRWSTTTRPTRPATAASSSSRVFPQPCISRRAAGNPARSAVSSSPSEQTSRPSGVAAMRRASATKSSALPAYETSRASAAAQAGERARFASSTSVSRTSSGVPYASREFLRGDAADAGERASCVGRVHAGATALAVQPALRDVARRRTRERDSGRCRRARVDAARASPNR